MPFTGLHERRTTSPTRATPTPRPGWRSSRAAVATSTRWASRPIAGRTWRPPSNEHRLDRALFHDLLSAFAQDVTTTRYADFPSLLDYCRRSANPIGRLLLALYRRSEPTLLDMSDAICSGLQLTNFWQDVAIDWAKGRVYVPQEDLRRFAVTERQIADQQVDDRWRALMAFEVARTRDMLAFGAPLASALGGRIGLELRLVVHGGLRILELIDAVGGDVFRRRPVLSARDWTMMSWRALRPVSVAA